jgi:hypothetical protein
MYMMKHIKVMSMHNYKNEGDMPSSNLEHSLLEPVATSGAAMGDLKALGGGRDAPSIAAT